MSAVAKSESLIYRDARQYCRRRHQKTMGKCAREERQGDALLARQLRHIQKSKSYRQRELDREQEECLTDLVSIFDRQCQIATTRLARRLKDALGDQDIVDGIWGPKKEPQLGKPSQYEEILREKQQSFLNRNGDNQPLGLPCKRPMKTVPHKRNQDGKQLPFLSHETPGGNNSVLPFGNNNRNRADSPRPRWQKGPRPFHQPKPVNQCQIVQSNIRDSTQLTPSSNHGLAKRSLSGKLQARPKTAPPIIIETNRWKELASPVRCPQHCKDASDKLRSARSLRCLLRENNRQLDKNEAPGLNGPEDVCFRRQYLANVMSRKLPVSGLRSGNFVQQDDVRKKMEARKQCMTELRMANKQRIKSAPPSLQHTSL